MIHDVDETLRAVLERDVLNGGVEVSFEAPTKEWGSRLNKPTINTFLYDIREDVSRRDVAARPIKNEQGRIVGRQPPARRFRLSYLLTAWTQRPEDEHRLLSQLISAFLAFDRIPPDLLKGSLAAASVPTVITLSLPPTQDRSLSDIWSALGGELKPSLDLQVIAPIDPRRDFETGPPVTEMPTVRVSDFDADPEDVEEERRKRSGVPLRPGVDDLEDEHGGDLIQVGNEEQPGRTFEIRRKGLKGT